VALESFTKQAYEAFVIAADFGDVLVGTEALSSSTVVATDKDDTDVSGAVTTSATKAIDGTEVQIQVKAGSAAASPYKITFKAVTDVTPANQWEKDITMKVKEL
jgi:hypothetical protein